MMGLWVIGHECGHHAFSQYKTINDCVGFLLHSVLLVPYFSWQRTHKVHHAKCNHILDGETHVPDIERKVSILFKRISYVLGEDGFALLQIIFHLGAGWVLYLFFHSTGSKRSPITQKKFTSIPNHFIPSNDFFPEKNALESTSFRFRNFSTTFSII